MNWFKKALFDANSECGEWLPAYRGGVKTCRLSNDSVLEIKYYDSSNLFQAFPKDQYNNATQTWPEIFISDQNGIEFMFHIDRKADVNEDNRGQAFSVMSKVIRGIQEISAGKDFIIFDAYKGDSSGGPRQSLYQSIVDRLASQSGFVQITTGSNESFLLVSSELYSEMKKNYTPIQENNEEDYEDNSSSGFTDEDERLLQEINR